MQLANDGQAGSAELAMVATSGAAAVAYWLGSTLKAEWMPRDDMGSDFKEGSKVQRTTGQLQGMACHSRR